MTYDYESVSGNMTQNEMLKRVYETGFALDDIILYLDTHPVDTDAKNYYRSMQQANAEAVKAYEQMFGPLMANSVIGDTWTWLDNPWPWEGGER